MDDLKKLHSEGIEKLVRNTSHRSVLNAMANNPQTKTDHLVQIMKQHDDTMAGDNAAGELHERELLGKYKDFTGKSKSASVKYLHVLNLKDPDEIRQRYKTHPGAGAAYIHNKHTPDDVLFHKHLDSGGNYGSSIAEHPNASKETLDYISNFSHSKPRELAKQRYRERFNEEPPEDTSDKNFKRHITRYTQIHKYLA